MTGFFKEIIKKHHFIYKKALQFWLTDKLKICEDICGKIDLKLQQQVDLTVMSSAVIVHELSILHFLGGYKGKLKF